MGLLRRIPQSGMTPNSPPAGAPDAEAAPAIRPPRAPEDSDQRSPRDVKADLRRSIIAELESDLNDFAGANLNLRIKEIFDRVVDTEQLTLTETGRSELFHAILA